MSRNTPRARLRIEELIEELSIGAAIRMRTDSDAIEATVRAVVAYLIDEYPGQDLYIPAVQEPQYPRERILDDLARNRSVRYICRKHRVSRRTVYRVIAERDEQSAKALIL